MTQDPLLAIGDRIIEGFTPDGAPQIHEDAALVIEGGRVAAIGPAAAMRARYPGAREIGGRGKVIMPGLINAHHHVGLTPFQLGSPDHPLELWFASRLALRDVDLRLDTLFSAFEMIASGVTTVQHLHSRAPGDAEAVLGAARKVIGAYREIGMRASYSMALRDQNRLVYADDRLFTESVPEALRPALRAYFERFTLPLDQQVAVFDALRAELAAESRIRLQIAPANLHWLSDAALGLTAELSARHGLPMHMHLLETPYQREYARRRTGGSALAHLARFRLVHDRLTLGHGVWMSEAEIDLCAAHGVRICHNCSSNFRLKSGIAPVNRFLAKGIPVCLGIDEAGINDDRDMLQEMRLVLRAHREPGIDAPHPSAAEVFRMATEHGAATTPFGGKIGSLRPGSEADLVVLDHTRITRPYQHAGTPLVDVLVHRAKPEAVEAVMVAGEVIYAEGRFLRIDRAAIHEAIRESLAAPLTPGEIDRRQLAEAVFPHVKAFYDRWLPEEPAPPHTHYNAR
ncbi:MAG: amidohydrolase family protein [Beijerinckiaceae bacterium]|nr:amidohydrolase family protein [Brevundimonas sp.]MCZ8302101.1 amidohydrolase family protein [Beijerinckiaceae bacterium]